MLQFECDVLVIGGGLAGCWAAIGAKEKAARVLLVEKGKVSRSGKSTFAGAGILCPYPDDDLDAWRKEIVERGEYTGDQDWIEIILQEQPARLREMESWGIYFERDDKGKFVRVAALGSQQTLEATVSSKNMMETLRKLIEDKGVQILDRLMITGLLTQDGLYPTKKAAIGAYGFHTRTGEAFTIKAGATVIATGGFGHFDLTGDGIAQAFRAGAEVWGMEFSRTMDHMSIGDGYSAGHLITLQRLGMRLINSRGERYMLRYNPQQKESVRRLELALATIAECLEGRGPIYMDLTHFNNSDLKKLRTLPTTSRRTMAIEREGIDFSKDKIAFNVHSGFIHSESGGIRHNIFAESTLTGLYVAGEAGGYPANGVGTIPLKLASCCVEGYRAGKFASQYAVEVGPQPLNQEQVDFLEKETFAPERRERGPQPQELLEKVNKNLSPAYVSIFRNKDRITKLISDIAQWKNEATTIKADNLYQLVKASKVINYIHCAELVFRSSLEREETRGANIRIDYPFLDNINWLKHIILRSLDKNIVVNHVQIPIYRYPVKPEKYEKIAVKFPSSVITMKGQ